jgi:hypothetical protein
VLRKDLLRVSRRGGDYRPEFVGRDSESLAGRVIDTFRDHVGQERASLDEALTAIEREADDFKLVRGFAALVEREATFETRAAVDPERARRTAFEAAESRGGVVTTAERDAVLSEAAAGVGVDPDAFEAALYADRDPRQVLVEFDPRWGPEQLTTQYNLSLAQTALFDATEVRVRSSDPRGLVTAVKRLGLMYEVRVDEAADLPAAGADPRPGAAHGDGAGPGNGDGDDDDAARIGDPDPHGEVLEGTATTRVPVSGLPRDREVVVTGPDGLFRRSRRYGTTFARLLRSVATASDWRLVATIDDRGTERKLTLTDADVAVPGVDPITDPVYDSDVERRFAARFEALDLDWRLVREPEALATGTRVMIPDFALDWTGSPTAFRVYLEIMGFWTPEYVEKKLDQIDRLEDVELVVAVDESLGVGEALTARDARVVTYDGEVRVKDVVDVLREYESELVADAADTLPAELTPEADVLTVAEVAAEYGVTVEALDEADVTFPSHERVGPTLVRPATLSAVEETLEPGMDYETVSSVLADLGFDDESAVLSRLGYRVEWSGLSGGTLRARETGP